MIDTRQVPAVQYMPGEITAMLEDLGTERYHELRKRVELQFGAENVSDKHPFQTP
jgi:hypothetical protein